MISPYYGEYSLCNGKHNFNSNSIIWEKLKAYGKNSLKHVEKKNQAFLASNLNETVMTNYTRYHKRLK